MIERNTLDLLLEHDVFSVMLIVECPSGSCPTFGCTPPLSASVAQVCRAVCRVMRGAAHFSTRRSNSANTDEGWVGQARRSQPKRVWRWDRAERR
jgi:hypothetical protein